MKNQSHKTIPVQFHKINANNYQSVWDFQSILHERIKADKFNISKQFLISKGLSSSIGHLIFCEHTPVFTLGKSADDSNLLSPKVDLNENGFEVFDINRGGDVTYHGPGQITAYFIVDVEKIKRDVHLFVRNLEQVVINVLEDYQVKGERIDDLTGVWVRADQGMHKVCAIGVHLSRWVSMHGLAFNINTDLEHFDNIIPCGISDKDKSVTSLARILGKVVDMQEVMEKMQTSFREVFCLEYIK